MKFEPEKSIAVFLGPSLDRTRASQILNANFYAPARMGDVYRLIGSGVRVILLIDGIFHGVASVWQRELLEAIENDILVVGASSMGALRAAELHRYGMVGVGTVFEWYRDEVINGDDEVALNHGDGSSGFRRFSEPMVNIRYNLMRAVGQGYLSEARCAELIECAKSTYYGARSYSLLINSPTVGRWPQDAREPFGRFIKHAAVDLKELDAVRALEYCADVLKGGRRPTPSASLPEAPNQSPRQWSISAKTFSRVSCLNRGFLHSTDYLVSGETLLGEVSKDVGLIDGIRPLLVKRHFLLLWASGRGLECPESYLDAYMRKWEADYVRPDFRRWLSANGLTEREFRTALGERALLDWMVEQEPVNFGVEFNSRAESLAALLSLGRGPTGNEASGHPGRHDSSFREAKEITYLAAWARDAGVVCPPAECEEFIRQWEGAGRMTNRAAWLDTAGMTEDTYTASLVELALCRWIVEMGPHYFGYTSWHFEVALIKELQMSGQAADYADRAARGLRDVV